MTDTQRHPDARRSCVLQREHDCYSLAWIMGECVCPEAVGAAWSQLVGHVREGRLAAALTMLEEQGALAQAVLTWVGSLQ
jgi:hypothetical protein